MPTSPLFHGLADLERNYAFFGRLAGIRGGVPLHSPRGLPSDCASETLDAYCVEVGKGHISLETAEKWVQGGSSTWVFPWTGTWGQVTNPDWHNASWLTLDEFANVVEGQQSCPATCALLAAAESLAGSGCEPRFVFWFDN